MRRKKRPLSKRVTTAAEAALAAHGFVSPVEVFLRIGWLNPNTFRYWQQGRIESLEEVMLSNPSRMSQVIELLWSWATTKGLVSSETSYTARTPQRQALRFSASGDQNVEQRYRIHWISGELSEKEREHLTAKASRAPELVVVVPLKSGWKCHRCGKSGDLLVMENPGPACLKCVGLDDLEFLPAGDALLTRRAKAKSARRAVVVRFSRTRRRYERQGLLVEPQAIAEAQRELAEQRQ